jgi:hypothetical protein
MRTEAYPSITDLSMNGVVHALGHEEPSDDESGHDNVQSTYGPARSRHEPLQRTDPDDTDADRGGHEQQ